MNRGGRTEISVRRVRRVSSSKGEFQWTPMTATQRMNVMAKTAAADRQSSLHRQTLGRPDYLTRTNHMRRCICGESVLVKQTAACRIGLVIGLVVGLVIRRRAG
eukprot:Rmarinus@m.19317